MQTDFSSVLKRFGSMGEKTGWTYLEVPEAEAEKMHDTDRKGFRVKGWLNQMPIAQVALAPMGEGHFILPVNAAMRQQLAQPLGSLIRLQLSKDISALTIAPELLECLKDDPSAWAFFNTLAPSHQKYFSNWVADAKTMATRTKRLVQVLQGLGRKMDYGTMIRWGKQQKIEGKNLPPGSEF